MKNKISGIVKFCRTLLIYILEGILNIYVYICILLKTVYGGLKSEEKIKIRKILHKDREKISVHEDIQEIEYRDGKIYVYYEYKNEDYIIVYSNPITEVDLKEISKVNMDVFPTIINESKRNNEDIYEIMRKYGGPMGNFHNHISEALYLEDIIDTHTHKSIFKEDDTLSIKDDMDIEYTFNHRTPIKL